MTAGHHDVSSIPLGSPSRLPPPAASAAAPTSRSPFRSALPSLCERVCRDNGRGHQPKPPTSAKVPSSNYFPARIILLAFSPTSIAKLEQSINGLVTSRQRCVNLMRSPGFAHDGRAARNPGMIRAFCWVPVLQSVREAMITNRNRAHAFINRCAYARGVRIRKDSGRGIAHVLRHRRFWAAADAGP